MTITALTTSLVKLPLPRPITTALHSMHSVGCVLVEVETADGMRGQGFAWTLNAARLRAFDEVVTGLAEFVVGRDPHDTEAIWHDIWREINPTGHKGITVSALAAIDVACWDAVARSAGLPLHKMFGACRSTTPTYASSGLWLSNPIDDLQAEAARFVSEGFVAVKARVGSPDAATDIERVAAIRDAVGPSIELLVDANQALTPKAAIKLGRQLEALGVTWFEEPVHAGDLVGHAEVRAALDLNVASGETEYTRFGISDMVAARAADVLMPDLQRIGGYSEFRKAAAVASAHHLPVSSHFFTEYSLAMAGSIANCVSVEHIDWFEALFEESMELRDGELVIPNRPGTGFTFRQGLAEEFPLP